MPTSEKERIVRAFLLLLHRESKKSESAIIPPTAWENLPELQAGLAQANDDIKIIARGITTWCQKHQYSSILQALRPVLSDSIPEDEDPDEDETEQQIRLGNLSLKFVDETISQAQGQHEQQSS
ncbi:MULTISPECIES: hypothetical protein [Limnospira]|uniref:hypothetical protein n=1 Tax=Limnospira TaxID=2596745 RepID=UPI0012C4D7F9|nr:hypothetical protein [Arthrospira sp. PLM2.Bin9]MDT9183329.1 hypothetical protein [Limnospira sp. PMC 289.06]MDT9295398.1 hypothetical protein [Arthrospira platensis PCC 7345]TVU55170.1 MAG: hypothetical protein EA414_03120 [Arthrospira sp. PLM2.Bin9]